VLIYLIGFTLKKSDKDIYVTTIKIYMIS